MNPPHTLLFRQPPDYTHLRVFGCLCYPNVTATAPHKLTPRSRPCVFLGYALQHRGYRCLDLETRKVIISRHVIFNENYFPFKNFHYKNNTDLEQLLEEIQTASYGPLSPNQTAGPTTSISNSPLTSSRTPIIENFTNQSQSPPDPTIPAISAAIPLSNPIDSPQSINTPNPNIPHLIISQNNNPLPTGPTTSPSTQNLTTSPLSNQTATQSTSMTSAPQTLNSHSMVTRAAPPAHQSQTQQNTAPLPAPYSTSHSHARISHTPSNNVASICMTHAKLISLPSRGFCGMFKVQSLWVYTSLQVRSTNYWPTPMPTGLAAQTHAAQPRDSVSISAPT
ncbi:hypothetical protein V2J09_011562 [Rumex salicifolius]